MMIFSLFHTNHKHMGKTRVALLAALVGFFLVGAVLSTRPMPDSVMGQLRKSLFFIKVTNSQGPWPECNWMTGEDCVKFIKSQAPDTRPQIMTEQDFHMNHDNRRVAIFVNERGQVLEVPTRA